VYFYYPFPFPLGTFSLGLENPRKAQKNLKNCRVLARVKLLLDLALMLVVHLL
jgi:hypothetical protein